MPFEDDMFSGLEGMGRELGGLFSKALGATLHHGVRSGFALHRHIQNRQAAKHLDENATAEHLHAVRSTRPAPRLTRWTAAFALLAGRILAGPEGAFAAGAVVGVALLAIALDRHHLRPASFCAGIGFLLIIVGAVFSQPVPIGFGVGGVVSAIAAAWWMRHRGLVREPDETDDEWNLRVKVEAMGDFHSWEKGHIKDDAIRRAFALLSWIVVIVAFFLLTTGASTGSDAGTGLALLLSSVTAVLLFVGIPSKQMTQLNYARYLADPQARSMAAAVTQLAPGTPAQGPSNTQVPASLPSFVRPDGLILGRWRKQEISATFEDSILVIGPPRSGKTTSLLIPLAVEAPGPVVTTSTRAEVAELTTRLRSQVGPVALFDPFGLASGAQIDRLLWSPVQGCEDIAVAVRRAQGMMGAISMANTTSGDFWQTSGANVLAACLHAAALSGGGVSALQKFLASTQGLQTALRALQSHNSGMVNALEGVIHAPSDTLGSMLATAQQTIQSLTLPSVRAVCDTDSSAPVEQLLTERATIHLVAPGDQGAIGPIFVALLSDIFAVASRNTSRPPLEFLLDEVANIAPLPSLPTMMSTGGGNGIMVLAVLQSLAQARGRWGEAGANALLDASTFKLIFPGLTQPQDLEALAALAGYEEVERTSTTSHDQGTSTTTGWERRPRMTASDIRELPKGTAYLLARNHPPLQIALAPYWERPYGSDVQ